MFKKKITLTIFLLLVFSDFLETFTQFCFKKNALAASAAAFKNLSGLFGFFQGAFLNWFLWLGLVSVIMTFIIWSSVLSRIDLSVAVPVASFSYVLVPLVSIILLREKISILRWEGIFFILIGVIFVSLSSKER
ncbi:MAG: EamA family transporter [Candidatus Omnitrophota bacterium]|nr:EamA family transporter [Candidatus Omnitrophota bacterium]